ncbi:MAG: Flp family type IVb pilin [Alphaproteobacteria bacterium]
MKTNKYLLNNRKGSTLTEYAVILGLVALVAWGAISTLGVNATNVFSFLSAGATSAAVANPTGLKAVAKLGT